MKEICIRTKDEVLRMEISELCEENLYDQFVKNPAHTIYVTQSDKVVGIVTVGDFWRNQLEEKRLITSEFTKVGPSNEHEAAEILRDKEWMDAVPVINEHGQIEKEYYKCMNAAHKNKGCDVYETIYQIISEVNFAGTGEYEQIIFLTDALSDAQMKQLQTHCKNDGILLTDYIPLADLKKYAGKKVCICDFCPESFRIRKIFYNKYKIEAIEWDIDKNEKMTYIAERANYFEAVAVFKYEADFFCDIIRDESVCILDECLCVWNDELRCFEYTGDIDSKVECVFVLACFLETPCIVVKNERRCIPVIGLEAGHRTKLLAGCYDIVYNIISKLRKNDVKILIIKDPDSDYDQIADILPSDIRNRRLQFDQNFEQKFMQLEHDSDKQILEELKWITTSKRTNGFLQIIDRRGKYANYYHGERYTVGNPLNYLNHIYMFGPCIFLGTYVEDQYTIGSYLRTMIPDKYYIKNCSGWFRSMNFEMRSHSYMPHDIVIFMPYDSDIFESNHMECHSIIQAYTKVPKLHEQLLNSLKHCNKIVNKYIAEEIYSICKKAELFDSNESRIDEKKQGITFGKCRQDVPAELRDWLAMASQKYKVECKSKAGAIVMNCNPFTLGHRYLIEKAAGKVDILYIFVLEEDKSFFDFKSRYDMVKKGVSDLDNVIVIPGGKYIISTNTMPGYFNKEDQPFVESDAVMDLHFFAHAVAKEFNIQIRFAGEEPKDEFTKKYNETMKRILPKYGIEFCEIPRKCLGETVISASLVRKYLAEQNYAAIQSLVMPCVYEFLKEKYFDTTSL